VNRHHLHYTSTSPGPPTARLDLEPAQEVVVAARDLVGSLRWRGGTDLDPRTGWQVATSTRWGHRNDFARWIRGDGSEPDEGSTMNCVEAVLFAAYRAGVVDRDWLALIHAEAADAASAAHTRAGIPSPIATDRPPRPSAPLTAYTATITRRLYSGPVRPYVIDRTGATRRPAVPAGHLVFFGDTIEHLALSLGVRDVHGHQRVLSLWALPDRFPPGPVDRCRTYGVMQETTVEKLAGALDPATAISYAAPVWWAGRRRLNVRKPHCH
jgi:hypothetical protein